MELQKVIGLRRSVRWLDPDRPVERDKLQMMLEAARRASHWGNVQSLRAVVVEKSSASPELLEQLGGHVGSYQLSLAPVVIVWFLDDASVDEQGTRLHEIVDARAMGVDHAKTKDYLDKTLIPFFTRIRDQMKRPGPSEIDCGQGIAQATLVAFEQGLGTCLLGGANLDKLAGALSLPETARILLLQTVGYPLEDVEASGQRPRLPFEELYKLNGYHQPFSRSEEVVRQLEKSGLIRPVGPDDIERRNAELARIAEQYDLPPY